MGKEPYAQLWDSASWSEINNIIGFHIIIWACKCLAGKPDLKGKKSDKPKKDEKLSNKSMGKMTADEVEDYKQAINLMTDCARLIYIRWLQTKLLKELVEVIYK